MTCAECANFSLNSPLTNLLLLCMCFQGLEPDMGPDPIEKEQPFNLLASIGLTQIVR